ncbi:extracellular solute-binding protein [Bradyrhizobium sp. ISRA443]|uniref:extracellular solute-binding protein n=1 Tax=unclassified Bradyrhizobium TaxID=2631580 RepID=UPI002479E684|nr:MULTISPECIES: extracellular solute-binding protein [unclassified Bradyrhizobium]WGR97895.1 extracellular solute-binding protein [Bradyrhizobium sp. ISRA436]WGS04785.1 extracellular solute-binding protein [Bradyrhizobium sp. ISRA437]WGS11666.1 extracellular solute-binding protein [Bradyrhizobium sp. ISRA443]
MKRIALTIIAVALGVGSASAADLNLLYGGSNLMTPVQNRLKEHFQLTHPGISVNLEPALEYTDAMAITLRQSLIGQAPHFGYFGISDVCILARRNIAHPLDDFIASDPEWASLGMPDSALEVTKCGSKTYGVPFSASFLVVMFNKQLVARAGQDPDHLPKTWPEILELARKIDATGGGIAFNYDASSSWSFMTLVESEGGKILSDDGEDIAFDSPEGLKALQDLADIGAARHYADMTKAQARQAFAAGVLGILVDSSSGFANYAKAAAGNFEIAVTPLPLAQNGRLPTSGMAGVLLTSDKKKSDLAWDYLKYGSSPDGQTLVGKLTGFLPFNRVAIESPERLASYYSERPELAAAAQSLKMAGSWPSFPGPNGLKVHAIITSYMQKVYTGVLDPAAALKAMAKETRALLK